MENWKQYPHSDRYLVSDLGRIKSKDTEANHRGGKRRVPGKILTYRQYANGGKMVVSLLLKPETKPVAVVVRRVIAETWIPNPESKPNVIHLDGDQTNVKASNLMWATQSEVFSHSKKNLFSKCRKDGETLREALEALFPYIAHDVTVVTKRGTGKIIFGYGSRMMIDYGNGYPETLIKAARFDWGKSFKLALRPLSDLIKPIEFEDHTGPAIDFISTSNSDREETLAMLDQLLWVRLPYWKIERLNKMHFDYRKLIEQAEAVDINTLGTGTTNQ